MSERSRDPHLTIHNRLLSNDPTASEALVRECLDPLVRILRRRYLIAPRDMIVDASADALLAHIQRPSRFEPDRCRLLTYLTVIAERRLLEFIRAVRRRERREIYVGGPRDLDEWRAGTMCGESHSEYAKFDSLPPELEDLVSSALPDPLDRTLLRLICEGRQSAEEYAEVLGLSGLPLSEQRAEIKRSRDRVLNRLRRRREQFRRARSDNE